LDTNGFAYLESIIQEGGDKAIRVLSSPYKHDGALLEDSRQGLRTIRRSGIRYIFAVIEPATWKDFIRLAIDEGIIGNPDYVWVFLSGMIGLIPEILSEEEYDIARAIHGSAVLLKDFGPNPTLDAKIVKLERDPTLQADFVSHYAKPEIFENFDFRYPGPNYPQYINYDSVMAIGLAACALDDKTTDFTITGRDVYNSLLQTEFEGVCGYVSFFEAAKRYPFKLTTF
jgi:hypothetical protein